jgi:membrane protease YdiL (CAAX protease family)
MWCPGVAAVLTQLVATRSLRGLGWRPGPPRYLLAGLALPAAYAAVAYVPLWATGLAGFPDPAFVASAAARRGMEGQSTGLILLASFVSVATAGVLLSLLTALGEEIGWRGLLAPQLARRGSFRTAALVSGAIWALWHYPLIIFGGYHGATPLLYSLLCFTVMVVGLSFPLAWLRLRAASLWPAALMHAAHNALIQSWFDPVTVPTAVSPYLTGEFGLALALVGVAFVARFWHVGVPRPAAATGSPAATAPAARRPGRIAAGAAGPSH